MNAAARDLRATNRDLPHIMPFPTMMDVFEEIAGRHEDEIEELQAYYFEAEAFEAAMRRLNAFYQHGVKRDFGGLLERERRFLNMRTLAAQ